MNCFPEVFSMGPTAASNQIEGMDSAHRYSHIIRTRGVTLHDPLEDMTWQR